MKHFIAPNRNDTKAAPEKQKLRVYCPLHDETDFGRLHGGISKLFFRLKRENSTEGHIPPVFVIYSRVALNHAYDLSSDDAMKGAQTIFSGLPDTWCAVAYAVREMRGGLPVSTLYVISNEGVQQYTGTRISEAEKKLIAGKFGAGMLSSIYRSQKGGGSYPIVRAPGGIMIEARLGEDLADCTGKKETGTITVASSSGMDDREISRLAIVQSRKAVIVNESSRVVWTPDGSGDRFKMKIRSKSPIPFFHSPDPFPYAALL